MRKALDSTILYEKALELTTNRWGCVSAGGFGGANWNPHALGKLILASARPIGTRDGPLIGDPVHFSFLISGPPPQFRWDPRLLGGGGHRAERSVASANAGIGVAKPLLSVLTWLRELVQSAHRKVCVAQPSLLVQTVFDGGRRRAVSIKPRPSRCNGHFLSRGCAGIQKVEETSRRCAFCLRKPEFRMLR
jgi:hypothetical protein